MFSVEDANIERFGRHVPRILGNQLISQLIEQYLSEVDDEQMPPDEMEKTCPPSVERFHAALLFVDISGFTVLSQRLPVDALRLHINAYFKKILDIIFKYGGDVIKFAGDALFIVWQTPVSCLGKRLSTYQPRCYFWFLAHNLNFCVIFAQLNHHNLIFLLIMFILTFFRISGV
jgi:hypothetical protein